MESLQTISRSYNGFLQLTGIGLFILFVLSNMVSLPNVVSPILALCWILLVPFAIGIVFTRMPIGIIRNLSHYLSDTNVANTFVKWAIGFLLIMLVSAPLLYAGVDTFAIGSGLLLIAIFGNLAPHKEISTLRLSPNMLRILIVGLILGISFAAYIRSFSPYPLTPGMDLFTHIFVVKSIINHAVQDSPVQYLATFHVLIALASSTFNAELVDIFWLGTFMLTSFFAISLYALSYRITRNHIHSIVTSIIGLSITEHGLVPNLQAFYPSSLIMSFFPLIILILYNIWKRPGMRGGYKLALMAIVSSSLILTHFQLGLVACFFALLYITTSYFTRYPLVILSIRFATITLAIILLLYYNGYITSQFELRVADGQYAYDTQLKIKHLKEWYTHEIMTISLFGLIVSSLFRNKRIVLIGFIAAIFLLVYFQKIDLIHRYMTLERPLLSFAAATFLTLPMILLDRMSIGKMVSKALSRHVNHEYLKRNIMRVVNNPSYVSKRNLLYLAIILILIFPVLMQPYDNYIKPYADKKVDFINFTNEELSAAKWIEENTPTDYVLYSDPFTVIEMRGLSYRKEIEAIGWNTTVADMVKSTFTSADSLAAYNKVISHSGEKTIIVITPRTSEWVRGSDYFVQFPVKEFIAFDGFEKFHDERYFVLLYQSDDIFVFMPVSTSISGLATD
jgi:hypothetical protein